MEKQNGFTLVEILISTLIGLIIVSATITLYVNSVEGSSDTIKSTRLNYDMESVMALMVNDIKRAGYWGGAQSGVDSTTNPFVIGTADLQIPAANCILYTYDADGDSVVDADEYYGFQLVNNTIQMRLTGTTTASCDDGNWSTLTVQDSVNITGLTFTNAYKCLDVSTSISSDTACSGLPSGDKAVESREVHITISGQLVSDSSVTKSLTDTVKVRNDRIFYAP